MRGISVKIFRFVLRLVGDAAKAEDVVSDVFLEVWRHAGRFEGRSQVGTWILAIARFKALTAPRPPRGTARRSVMAEGNRRSGRRSGNRACRRRTTARSCALASRNCRPDHRAVIDLVYYHEQVRGSRRPTILGVPRNTVKTRMFYARKRIGELYRQSDGARVYHA